jgi:hypothetical protein
MSDVLCCVVMFTLAQVSADGYHVGWCQQAGSDYDFYNTKHEILHSVWIEHTHRRTTSKVHNTAFITLTNSPTGGDVRHAAGS